MWMAKGKILIAVPTFENIKPQCFKSIYGLANPKDFNLYFDYVKGYDCARARNEIAKLAIKHDFDYVLMIDSDVSVPKETLNKLLDCRTVITFHIIKIKIKIFRICEAINAFEALRFDIFKCWNCN